MGQRGSGGSKEFYCGEFLGCEGSERTQGMERQEDTPHWLGAQTQRPRQVEKVCGSGGI